MKRRQFLTQIAQVAGAGAAYAAMCRLGMIATAAAAAETVPDPTLGAGKRVVVIGGGIAGLVATYELERWGFEVTLLEARDRLGGKSWTLRAGSEIEMRGEATQRVAFADGLYMDAGPSRIPSDHQRLLGYCRKLEVPLEVDANMSRAAFLWSPRMNGGKAISLRQAANDTRGYLSELLAKATNRGALDAELTLEDKQRLLRFLQVYGDLEPDDAFRGTDRSGLVPRTTPMEMSRNLPPLAFADMLKSPELRAIVYDEQLDQQATMLQPAGGMDRIAAAFEKAIRAHVYKGMELTRLTAARGRVEVIAMQRSTNAYRTFTAEHVVVTIPPHLLAQIEAPFSKDVKSALASFAPDYANKIGFDTPRFWEREGVYGGWSFVDDAAQMIGYPSGGIHQPRGVLLGCYNRGILGRAFAAKPVAEQIAIARAAIAHIHPGHEGDLINPAVVNWSKVPFSLGPWAYLGRTREGHIDNPALGLLNAQSGPIHFAGAYLTQLPGWQEGAAMSAQDVVAKIVGRSR